jgi:hypothetical protein
MHAPVIRIPEPRDPVVVVAPIGPHSAPLGGLIRVLYQERSMAVAHAYLVAGARELKAIHDDVLDSGRLLDRLREMLGDQILDHDGVHLVPVHGAGGEILEDDLLPEHASCFREALWNAARDAIARAGSRPVVFAMLHGARRTAAALVGAFYQLLARPQDVLLDVRILPGTDGVRLVELELPRLAGLVGGASLTSFASALAVARSHAPVSPPKLVIDLLTTRVEVEGIEVDLSPAEGLWYAYLALRRGETVDGWVIAGQDGHEAFAHFLRRAGARRRTGSIRCRPLRDLLEGQFVHDEDLRNLRGKTVQRMKRWCGLERPEWAQLLVPEADNHGHQRLPLPAHAIEIRGLPRE